LSLNQIDSLTLKIPKVSKQLLFAYAPIFNIRKQDPLFTALVFVSFSTFGTDSVVGTWKALVTHTSKRET
jgi:hypothetical protein